MKKAGGRSPFGGVISCGVLFCALLFPSCTKGDQAASVAPASVGPSPAVAVVPAAEVPSLTGTVTFICGTASMTVAGVTSALDIGLEVPSLASVSTDADSVCEIQFADFGSVHLAPGSTLVVDRLLADSTHTESAMSLEAGKVVCKVRKLSGDDSFQVRTTEMVCGVRGTVFQVSKDAKKPVRIAVNEGAVAVYPPSIDAGKALSEAVSVKLDEAAPVVRAGDEAIVTPEAIAALDSAFTEIVATSAAEGATKPDASVPESVSEDINEYTLLASTVLASMKPVSEETRGDFAVASNLALGAPAAPIAASPDASSVSDSATVAPAAVVVPARVRVAVTVDPAEAATTINDASGYRGSFSGLFTEGETLNLKVELAGYATANETVSVTGAGEIQRNIKLEKLTAPAPVPVAPAAPAKAKPVPVTPPAPAPVKKDPTSILSVSALKLIGLAPTQGGFFLSDAKGGIAAVGADGKVSWTAQTGNGSNAINPPVALGQFVAFAGDKALAVFDAASGKIAWTFALDKTNTGLYGRRPALYNGKLFLGSDSGIAAYDLASGAPAATVKFADGTDMTPAISGGKVYVVSKTGAWHSINADTLAIERSLETGAIQPVASACAVRAATVVFADRKGTVTAIDSSRGALMWQARLDEGKSVEVFADPVLTASGAYVFAKNKLYGLAISSGKPLFAAIDATSQAVLADGELWCGVPGNAVVALSPTTGAVTRRFAVPAAVSGTPIASGSKVLFPLANGQSFAVSLDLLD